LGIVTKITGEFIQGLDTLHAHDAAMNLGHGVL
jgi:hypothetical protein